MRLRSAGYLPFGSTGDQFLVLWFLPVSPSFPDYTPVEAAAHGQNDVAPPLEWIASLRNDSFGSSRGRQFQDLAGWSPGHPVVQGFPPLREPAGPANEPIAADGFLLDA